MDTPALTTQTRRALSSELQASAFKTRFVFAILQIAIVLVQGEDLIQRGWNWASIRLFDVGRYVSSVKDYLLGSVVNRDPPVILPSMHACGDANADGDADGIFFPTCLPQRRSVDLGLI
jgi:hypothetical protein